MRRVVTAAALALTGAVLTVAVAGPPVLHTVPVPVEARAQQQDHRYQPDTMSTRQSATYLTSAVGFDYTGPVGPASPLDVGTIHVATGRYLISFSLPVRFAGLTADPLSCSLVERRSGIPLEPVQSVQYESGAEWTVAQVDMPVSLPEMRIALRCATADDTVGKVEIGELSLLAKKA